MSRLDDFLLSSSKSSQQYVISNRHGQVLCAFDPAQVAAFSQEEIVDRTVYGRGLYSLVFPSGIPITSNRFVRILVKSLQADPVGEFSWEALHDGKVFLCLSPSTAIVRLHTATPGAVANDLPISAPFVRMLVTAAADVPTEVEALRELGAEIGLDVVVLTNPTRAHIFGKLQEASSGKAFSLWHHIGAAEMQDGSLILSLPKGDSLSVQQINRALSISKGIKVLTLNLNGGVRPAAQFYQINVPLLLASTHTLDPFAAMTFFRTFYTTVWRSGMASAVQQARTAMSNVDFGTHDWATILHLQTTQADNIIPTLDTQGDPSLTQRDQLFISYSHQDAPWLEKLQPYLNALALHFKIVIWDDRDLAAGQRWHDAIMGALNRAKVVLVLASVNYFGSSYIAQHELPTILKATASGDMTLLWVPVSSYSYHITALKDYQAVFDPKAPLDRRDESGQQDALLAISDAILRTINGSSTPSSPT